MDYFFAQLFNGLSLGTIYALIAIGFATVYGILGFLNFAHSEVFTAGAFGAFFGVGFALEVGLPPYAAVAIGVLGGVISSALLAAAVEIIGYRPLRGAPKVFVFLSAVGISITLQITGIRVFGAPTKGFPNIDIGLDPRIFAVGALLVSCAALFLMVYRTNFGLRMRAISMDLEAARIVGIPVNQTITQTFLLGGALAGVAGLTWGLLYGVVHPQMGFLPGLKSFIIAVLGTIGRIWGTVSAALAVGILETLVGAYLPSQLSVAREPIVFLALLLLLVWRPGGLLPNKASGERV